MAKLKGSLALPDGPVVTRLREVKGFWDAIFCFHVLTSANLKEKSRLISSYLANMTAVSSAKRSFLVQVKLAE
jgi:hypothetical protein